MTNFGLEKRFVNQFAQPFAGRISSFMINFHNEQIVIIKLY